MTTDEEKSRLAKLLDNLEVPECKLSDRCSDLVKEFHKKFDKIVETEENETEVEEYDNPYIVNKTLLEEIEKKLKLLVAQNHRFKMNIYIYLNDCNLLKY